jgi:transposase-like protein
MKTRRKFTPEYKAKLVLEMVSGQRSPAEIARKEGIKDALLYEWRAEFIRSAPMIFSDSAAKDDSKQADKIAELEQVIGRLTIENEALKKASRWLNGMSKPNER